jgi:hypothetical protein
MSALAVAAPCAPPDNKTPLSRSSRSHIDGGTGSGREEAGKTQGLACDFATAATAEEFRCCSTHNLAKGICEE